MDPPTKTEVPAEETPSTTDLLSSAKVVAEAAQSTFSKGADTIDKSKVADATGDLLGAASQYGKLEDKGYGKYVDKAEDYLHQYGSSQPAAKPADAAEAPPSSTPSSGNAPSEGGVGDYVKMAESFVSSTDSADTAKSEGGVGGYMKMAEGFLKKN